MLPRDGCGLRTPAICLPLSAKPMARRATKPRDSGAACTTVRAGILAQPLPLGGAGGATGTTGADVDAQWQEASES